MNQNKLKEIITKLASDIQSAYLNKTYLDIQYAISTTTQAIIKEIK